MVAVFVVFVFRGTRSTVPWVPLASLFSGVASEAASAQYRLSWCCPVRSEMFSIRSPRRTGRYMQKFESSPEEVLPDLPSELPPIDEKMLGRVDRMQQAYAAGEIDDEMIAKAAKVLRITEDEARRRLSSRVASPGSGSVSRTERRRKNKSAKASRRKNRH